MSLKSKGMWMLAKRRPHYLLVPFVPMALTITSFVMSLTALRRVRRLSHQ